jgi:Spy/CpxP family protein refolding chaperone
MCEIAKGRGKAYRLDGMDGRPFGGYYGVPNVHRFQLNARIRRILWAVVPAAGVLISSSAWAASDEWWNIKHVQRALELTPSQVRTIDAIFRHDLAERKRLRATLDRLELRLARAMARGDQVAVELIDVVENTRARRNVLRTLMLFRMHGVLSPRQRELLSRLSAGDTGSKNAIRLR